MLVNCILHPISAGEFGLPRSIHWLIWASLKRRFGEGCQLWPWHYLELLYTFSGWWFSPLPGEMIQFDYVIFFTWVETTNQFSDIYKKLLTSESRCKLQELLIASLSRPVCDRFIPIYILQGCEAHLWRFGSRGPGGPGPMWWCRAAHVMSDLGAL